MVRVAPFSTHGVLLPTEYRGLPVCRSVCLSVGLSVDRSVTLVSPAKTAEPIEMRFGFEWAKGTTY